MEPHTEAVQYYNLLAGLLAVIHRDGGHYCAQHGIAKATADAITIVHQLRADEESKKIPGCNTNRPLGIDFSSSDDEFVEWKAQNANKA